MREFVIKNRNKVNNIILNHLDDAVVLLSVDGEVLYVNKHVGELLNMFFNSKVIGSHFTTFLHQDSIDTALADLTDLVRGKQLKAVVYRFNSTEGVDLWVKVVPQLIPIMGDSLILLTLYDVSSRKEMRISFQEEIQCRFDHYHTGWLMADNLSDLLWAKDTESCFLFVNKAFCDQVLIAMDVQEPIGKTEQFFADRQRSLFPDNSCWYTFDQSLITDQEVMTSGQSLRFVVEAYVLGQAIRLEICKVPFFDEKGTVIGTLGCAHDITSLHLFDKKLDELKLDKDNLMVELLLAKEKAAESGNLKTALLNNMSHEFRTPLNSILGFSSLLSEAIDDTELKKMALVIFESGTRLLHTLDAILDMSLLESGLMRTDDVLIDFHETTLSLLGDYTETANKKGVEISFECTQKFKGYIDLRLYSLIVNNLVDNALRFTYTGSVIVYLTLAMINHQNVLILKVSDTGVGVSPNFQKAIFKEFFKVESGNIQSLEGVGLGLALVRKSLTLLNGDITLESSPGVGSVFTVYIPLSKIFL